MCGADGGRSDDTNVAAGVIATTVFEFYIKNANIPSDMYVLNVCTESALVVGVYGRKIQLVVDQRKVFIRILWVAQ